MCVGLNYRDHAIEDRRDDQIPTRPTIFSKIQQYGDRAGAITSLIPRNTEEKPDYEAEFAFVIGKGGRHINAADWQDHVFGYMNLNDVSARGMCNSRSSAVE